MKKRLSLFLVFILFLTNINLNKVYADTLEDEYATMMMAQLYSINDELDKYGLSLEDFKKMPIRDEQFYKDIKNHFLNTTTQSSLKIDFDVEKYLEEVSFSSNTSPNQDAINRANRWSYARKMAVKNMSRDNNAKDISKEVSYMYLSHFIDIRDGIKEYVDESISDDLYFSAWITNDDRSIYERYLKGSKTANTIKEGSDLAVGIYSTASGLKSSLALEKTIEFKRAVLGLNAGNGYFSVTKEAEDLIDILTESSNSEEAIKRIEDSLSGKIQKAPNINEKLAIVLNLFIAAVTTGFTGVIIAIGIYGANFAIGKSKEAFDKLWWISLVRTNSLRVSYRIMRNQGWL